MKQVGIIFVLLLLSGTLLGQKIVRFVATTNAKEIVKGSVLEVVFTLENAEGENFQAPTFSGFQVVSGPSIMANKTFVNGRLSQSYAFGYALKATKLGVATIAEATIKVDKKTYRTQPLKIEIVAASTVPSLNSHELAFIKPEFNVKKAYVGQQVLVSFKLYSTKEILRTDVVSVPQFAGTFAQALNFFDYNNNLEIVNGKQYYSRVLQQYAIFPQKEGQIEIDEMNASVKLMDLSGAFSRVLEEEVVSKTTMLEVIPFRQAPAKFSGGVGQFDFEVVLTKEKINTDESTTLTLNIIGTGDMKAVQIPKLEGLEKYFEIYEPTVNTQLAEQNNQVVGQKVLTYLLVPKKTGAFRFAPTFTYFDTDSDNFRTISSDTFNIIITKGSGALQDNSENYTDDGVRDIKPLLNTTSFSAGKPHFFGTLLFWGLWILPLFALLIAIFIKRKQVADAKKDPVLIKIGKADKVALKRLAQAEIYLTQGEQRAFYDEISKALWGYVSDKLVINRAELSKENIRSKLIEKQVQPENVNHFINILNTCEMAVFAGIGSTADMTNVYNQAKKMIIDIENVVIR